VIAFLKRLLGGGTGQATPGPGRVNPQEAKALVDGGALIVDVRTPAERQSLRIPGSKALPLHDLEARYQTLPLDRDIILQCASGSRSAGAARMLASHGYRAHNLVGGIAAWQQAGLPVKRG
jgi:rhodanese-related sulfurtransferase